ncbi:MAG: hypothetical protein M3220_10960 [Chloroflexota bacterium]|nr:hypothetical protein [Chloroflexota bacterium]
MKGTRILLLASVAVVFLAVLSLSGLVVHGSDPNPTYACASPTGQVRLIPADTGCYPDEGAVVMVVAGTLRD